MARAAKLLVTRGLPASGKTTWAKSIGEVVRVNRDDLRKMLFNAEGVLPWDQEELVSQAQQKAVRAALKQDRTVVVDDTNLRLKYVRMWEQLAKEENAYFVVVDFFDVSVEECILRDSERAKGGGRKVGADVIHSLYTKFLASHGGELPLYSYDTSTPAPVRKYLGSPKKPVGIIVDLDGTLAHRQQGPDGTMRGPFDWHRVYEDEADVAVKHLVMTLYLQGFQIIYVSGRDAVCRDETYRWIKDFGGPPGPLFMRSEGDNRKDTVVKAEIFWRAIADNYDVLFALDDRNSVVAMWREMGVKCLQVELGDF